MILATGHSDASNAIESIDSVNSNLEDACQTVTGPPRTTRRLEGEEARVRDSRNESDRRPRVSANHEPLRPTLADEPCARPLSLLLPKARASELWPGLVIRKGYQPPPSRVGRSNEKPALRGAMR
jgi:hypothetical protein